MASSDDPQLLRLSGRQWVIAVCIMLAYWNGLALLRIAAFPTDWSLDDRRDALWVVWLDQNSWVCMTLAALGIAQFGSRFLGEGPRYWGRLVLAVLLLSVPLTLLRYWAAFTVSHHFGWIPNGPSLRGYLVLLPSNTVFFSGLVAIPVAFLMSRAQWTRRAELTEARLEALRLQLNPHFLFNALNTVAALIPEQPQTAEEAVEALSRFLRHAISSRAREIPLADERRAIHAYVALELLRFGDWLDVNVDFPVALDNALVPPLILQPIIENAIRHGVVPRGARGRIDVCAAVREHTLLLTVQDDGVGFGNGGPSRGTGVGLANVRARLRQTYGDAAALEVSTPAQGTGTLVSLRLPLRQRTI